MTDLDFVSVVVRGLLIGQIPDWSDNRRRMGVGGGGLGGGLDLYFLPS